MTIFFRITEEFIFNPPSLPSPFKKEYDIVQVKLRRLELPNGIVDNLDSMSSKFERRFWLDSKPIIKIRIRLKDHIEIQTLLIKIKIRLKI